MEARFPCPKAGPTAHAGQPSSPRSTGTSSRAHRAHIPLHRNTSYTYTHHTHTRHTSYTHTHMHHVTPQALVHDYICMWMASNHRCPCRGLAGPRHAPVLFRPGRGPGWAAAAAHPCARAERCTGPEAVPRESWHGVSLGQNHWSKYAKCKIAANMRCKQYDTQPQQTMSRS